MNEKEFAIQLDLSEEKRGLMVNIMSFFASVIPTLITLLDKFWVAGSGIQPQVSIPINALGVFTICGHFVSTLDKVLKKTAKEKINYFEFFSNIFFLIIYGLYIVIVPVSYFSGIDNIAITVFSFGALLLRAFQSFIAMLVNIGRIIKYSKMI